ncbi:MAG: beta-xylosidase, partial [Chitinophagaceae bacterium]
TYYSAGTSSEWAPHFPIFTSNDLQTWHHAGYAFKEKPKWTLSSFWAPELFYRNGLFYLYYTAKRASDSISCLGVATSSDPAKGFTDHGVLLAHGKEAIDAFVIEDENKLFVTYKAYGLDQRPIELLGAELSSDGLKVIGEPFSLLQDTARKGLEGQCIIKNNGYFYLFYSVGGCCGIDCSYAIEVARSKSLKGPYVKSPNNPLLSETQNWKCPGHGTIVNTGNNDWYYMFHAYNKKDDVYTGRQGLLGKMEWEGEWPVLLPGTDAPQPITKKDSDFQWQWDFRHGIAKINSKKENICFEAEADNNPTGTVVTVRPYSGDYTMSVKVEKRGTGLRGVAIYGDANAAVGVGLR